MATAKKTPDDEVEVIETNGAKDVYRMSITVDQSTRRHIRIAAALADMEVGEWACAVLERAATKATAEVR